ncbi:ATP-dependent DNA helicase RecQ, partial [archaeon]
MTGISVAYYHASLPLKERALVLEGFLRDEVQVVVCTTAFGLGINKPDIRLVIHYGLPLSMEGYYQQTGRAGRDFMQSECVLLWNLQDVNTCHFLLSSSSAHTTTPAYTYATTLGDAITQETEVEQQVKTVLQYAKGQDVRCRREFILRYFQEGYDYVGCGINCCDLCDAEYNVQNDGAAHSQEGSQGEVNLSYEVFLLLHTMYLALPVSYGMNMYVEILLGKHTKHLVEKIGTQYAYLPTFGKGIHHTADWWKALMTQLVDCNGFIQANKMKNALRYTYVTYSITELGKQYLSALNYCAGSQSPAKLPSCIAAGMMNSNQGGNLYDMLAQPPIATSSSTYSTTLPTFTSTKSKKGLVYDPLAHKIELKLSKDFLKVHHAVQAINQHRTSTFTSSASSSSHTRTSISNSININKPAVIPAKPSTPSIRQSIESELLQRRNSYAQFCHLPPYYLCTTAELSDLVDYVTSSEVDKSVDEFISSRYASAGEVKQWKREFIEQMYVHVRDRVKEQDSVLGSGEEGGVEEKAGEQQESTLKRSSCMLNTSSGQVQRISESAFMHNAVAIPIPEKPKISLYIPTYSHPIVSSEYAVKSELAAISTSSSSLKKSQSCPPLSQGSMGGGGGVPGVPGIAERV